MAYVFGPEHVGEFGPCPFGDPVCPCQDGDSCHYVAMPGSPAMEPPTQPTEGES